MRFIIKLQKIWQSFLDGWNATVGPLVADINNLADDLTGGVLSEFGVVMDELKTALKAIAEEELLTFKDIFGNLNTCVQKGYGEKLFLWSDMSHYRRPAALCQALSNRPTFSPSRRETWRRAAIRNRPTKSGTGPSSSSPLRLAT